MNSVWSAVGAIATVVAAIGAIWTLVALKRDSRDRTRPVMSADIRPALLSRGAQELIVENVGQSVAKKVKVTFTPGLPDNQGTLTPFLKKRYANVLPTVPPRRQFTNLYFVGSPNGTGTFRNTEPLPDEIRVTFTYEDSHGRDYTDSYDLKVIWGTTSSDPSDTDALSLQKRMTKALEVIAQTLGRR